MPPVPPARAGVRGRWWGPRSRPLAGVGVGVAGVAAAGWASPPRRRPPRAGRTASRSPGGRRLRDRLRIAAELDERRARAPRRAAPARRRRCATGTPPARRGGDPRPDRVPAVQAPLLIGGQRRRRSAGTRAARSAGGGVATSVMRAAWSRARRRRARRLGAAFALGRGLVRGRRIGGLLRRPCRSRSAAGGFLRLRFRSAFAAAARSASRFSASAFSASARAASAARAFSAASRGRLLQVRAAAGAEAGVAAVQLAAAGAGAADARLAEHGLAARACRASASIPCSSASSAPSRCHLLLDQLAAVLLAPPGLVDEAAEVAQGELARAAQEPRAAAQPAAAAGHAAALEVLGRDARGQALPVLARGGSFGGGSVGRRGSAVGSVRVSSAAPGRLMRRRRPLMNVRNARGVRSERV